MRDSDPGGVVRRVVSAGSSAAGRTLRDLPLGERTWVRAVSRDGKLMPIGGETVLEEGDDVELVLDVGDVDRLDDLFG
jgi:Trk K+ transport system NAD-binding subunit